MFIFKPALSPPKTSKFHQLLIFASLKFDPLSRLLSKYPDKPWDWEAISQNSNLTLKDVLDNPDKPWDWYWISVNKNITIESLMRQKKILTRLLEVENALREQDQDNKRESKTASTQYEKIVKETLEKYKQEQLEQIEMIKVID